MSELPKGWGEAKISEVARLVRGVNYKKEHARDAPGDGILPVLRANNIDRELNFENLVYVPERRVSADQKIRKGDIVIAMSSGSKNLVGKAAQAQADFEGGFGAFCGVVRPSESLEPSYLGYFFQSEGYRKAVSKASAGVNINNLKKDSIESLSLPIAPLPEQRRIVARIEELFSRLDAGVAALRHAKTQLQRYRQSVLAAAVTGQLTQAWREQHPDKESAEELLKRILEQRRQQWNSRGKYKEPKGIDAGDFTPLPEGWVWSSGEQHFDWSSGKGLTKKEQQPGEVPVIGGNGVLGTHSEANVMTPTIVVGRVGAQCGNIYRTTEPAWITDNAIYATFVPVTICLPFIEMAFRTANLNSRAGGSGQPFVNQGTLNELEIALPPLAEQHQIVAEVEARTTAIDHLEAELDRQITRSNSLRQSTLASAFSGNLIEPTEIPS